MSESEPATVWKRAGWNNSTITSLAVPNGKAALDFWVRAFGAVVVDETLGPNGELFHGVLRVGDTILMASEPAPAMGVEASRVSLYYYVPDTDVAFKRALDAGATQLSPVQDQFWGNTLPTLPLVLITLHMATADISLHSTHSSSSRVLRLSCWQAIVVAV